MEKRSTNRQENQKRVKVVWVLEKIRTISGFSSGRETDAAHSDGHARVIAVTIAPGLLVRIHSRSRRRV